MTQRTRTVLLAASFGIVALFAAYSLFYKLGVEPIQDYDEATYAEITDESLARGNYLSLTFLNNDYFRKPPLLFWMMDASRQVVPDAEAAARLPSVLSAFALVFLVMLVVYEAGAGKATALAAGAILAGTSSFMEPAREARFDILVSLWIVAALYCGMRAMRNPRWYLAMGACVGLAILSKNVIAVFAPIALLVYFYQTSRFAFLRNGWFWGGVGVFFLIAAPWHLYETIRFGSSFWQSYLGTQVIERAQTNLFVGTNSPTNGDYFGYMAVFAAPWIQLFCVSVLSYPFLRKYMNIPVRRLFITSVIALCSVLAVMLWSKTKAITYLIPMYPFMAIALALAFGAAWRAVKTGYARAALLGVFCLLVLSSFHLTTFNVFHVNPYYRIQYSLAREEYAIADLIRERTDNPILYTYKNDNLGTIQYYTRLPFSEHPYVYTLENAQLTDKDAFVVTTASADELRAQFPHLTFTQLYKGSALSLFAIAS